MQHFCCVYHNFDLLYSQIKEEIIVVMDVFNVVFSKLADKANINDAEIARRLGVNRSTITRWRSGDQSPPLSKIPAIAALFDVHPCVFVGGEQYAPQETESRLIAKFRELDSLGKHTVQTVLNVEYERCMKQRMEPIAAHNDDMSDEQLKLMMEDIDEL